MDSVIGRVWRVGPLLAILLLMGTSGSAVAQSWMHPELVDSDAVAEERSEFWERMLATDDAVYRELVSQAHREWKGRGKEQRERALTALRTAAASRSDKPLAFYWLGRFLAEDQQWQACAVAFTKVYELDPNFSPEEKAPPNPLDYDIATCMLYGGDYEGSIRHLKRIVTLRSASDMVEQKLGEALMALGHLDEAIEFLASANARSSRYETKFILAVALDRAERVSESREILRIARDRDSDLSSLRSADKIYAPEVDEHYFLGLAYAISTSRYPAKKTYALYHWRRYLALAPKSQWRQRAHVHLAAAKPSSFAEDLKLQGHIAVDAATVKLALKSVEKPARACIEGHPDLLIRVDLNAVIGKQSSPWQVRATTLLAASTDKEDESRLISCVESALRNLPNPKLVGTPGRHASAHFSLLGGQ